MTSNDFVQKLRHEIIEEGCNIYQQLFANTPIDKATDPYWRRALSLFAELTPDQKAIFFEVIRQVSVDTTATFLGILDGIDRVESIDDKLELIFAGSQKLNGDLLDMFLEAEENR